MNSIFDSEISAKKGQRESVITTPTNIAKKSFFYVQETGYLKSLKPHISQRENLDSYLFIYVLSGSGYFTYQGKKTQVEKGACFFLDCMEPYSHESIEESPWELLWVHFNGATSREYYKYTMRSSSNIFYPVETADIITLIWNLIHTNQKKPPYCEAISSSVIVQLLTLIITTPRKTKLQSSSSDSMDEKLSLVRQYLSKHYTEKINLEQLADTFFISKYYLCREFKKKYGESIVTYLTLKRINNAKELLRFSDKNISEIATLCGVSDANYFIKQFKASEGITPAEYRRKW